MKLFKLVLCGSLLLCPIGCASQRESVMSPPVVPVETSPTGDTPESQPVLAPKAPSHPIREKIKDAADAAGLIILAPFLFSVLAIGYGLHGGLPSGC